MRKQGVCWDAGCTCRCTCRCDMPGPKPMSTRQAHSQSFPTVISLMENSSIPGHCPRATGGEQATSAVLPPAAKLIMPRPPTLKALQLAPAAAPVGREGPLSAGECLRLCARVAHRKALEEACHCSVDECHDPEGKPELGVSCMHAQQKQATETAREPPPHISQFTPGHLMKRTTKEACSAYRCLFVVRFYFSWFVVHFFFFLA